MILDDILSYRREQLRREKEALPYCEADRIARAMPPVRDFAAALKAPGLSVIAEVKKASPSKGVISEDFRPVDTAKAYQQAGAAAISVLTEEHYFQGNNDYLIYIRQAVDLPLLRKDFLYDPYQIAHARAMGADAVLLIAAMLDKGRLEELLEAAREYKIAALVEVHDEEEMETALSVGTNIIGINNRNLKTFTVSLDTSRRLIPSIPDDCIAVVESGIKGVEEMREAGDMGADAVLVGEALMRSADAGSALLSLRGKA